MRLTLNSRGQYRAPASDRWLAGLEWLFLVVGLVALDIYVWVNTSSLLSQAYQDWAFDQRLRGLAPSVSGFVTDEVSWMFGQQREKVEAPAAAAKLQPMPEEKTLPPS